MYSFKFFSVEFLQLLVNDYSPSITRRGTVHKICLGTF